MNTLHFVTGASGSGKTAILPDLRKMLGDHVAVFDFDDIGVPNGADKQWRQAATEQWLQKLLNHDQHVCLLGQMVLGEILACPSVSKIQKVNCCLLDVDDFERIERLKKRSTSGVEQNMLNWAAWLRQHHQDPQWMQHVLKEDSWDGMNFHAWDKLISWNNHVNRHYLDSTYFSIDQVAKHIADWIKCGQKAS